jgi:hypothetical protein
MNVLRKSLGSLMPLAALALAGCGDGEEVVPVAVDHSDPLMEGALADHIMVDPDMVARNGANQVASFASGDGSIPLPDSGPEAIIAARNEAIELVGGNAALRRAPPPERTEGELPAEAVLSVAARAAATPGSGNRDCAALAQFSATWAARMPATFPVYPRGAVSEAAGTDDGSCRLRVVNFTTPVPLADVMDFYYTRAMGDGFTVQRIMQGGDHVLGGTSQARSFMVFARPDARGLTSVDLVTTGGL